MFRYHMFPLVFRKRNPFDACNKNFGTKNLGRLNKKASINFKYLFNSYDVFVWLCLLFSLRLLFRLPKIIVLLGKLVWMVQRFNTKIILHSIYKNVDLWSLSFFIHVTFHWTFFTNKKVWNSIFSFRMQKSRKEYIKISLNMQMNLVRTF